MGFLDITIHNKFNAHAFRLAEVEEELQAYADYLGVYAFRARPVTPEQKRSIRRTFERHVRDRFLEYVVQHYHDELRQIGLDDREIKQVSGFGGTRSPAMRRLLDGFNVDHLNPVYNGGSNSFLNLCLIPKRIHDLKNKFQDSMIIANPKPTVVKVILPQRLDSGLFPAVLALPGFIARS